MKNYSIQAKRSTFCYLISFYYYYIYFQNTSAIGRLDKYRPKFFFSEMYKLQIILKWTEQQLNGRT